MSRIVFTGGPGVGKTTVLMELQASAYSIVGDSARTIIQDRRSRGLSPRPNPCEFAQEVLRMDVENYTRHAVTSGTVFFDRSVVDALGMLNQVSPLILLCHKRSLAFTRRQHGHRGNVLSKAAAIRSRKVVMDDGTWRCVRWAASRLVMRG